jgi:hypothetical protein
VFASTTEQKGCHISHLFVPEILFDILVKRQISRLEQPGIQCVDLVYEELQRIASQSEPTELTRFPKLRDRMVEVVLALLKRCVGPTQMMVANLAKIELVVRTGKMEFHRLYRSNMSVVSVVHQYQSSRLYWGLASRCETDRWKRQR